MISGVHVVRDPKMCGVCVCVCIDGASRCGSTHLGVRIFLNRSPGLSGTPISGAQGTGRSVSCPMRQVLRAVELYEYINVRSLSYRVASVVRIYGGEQQQQQKRYTPARTAASVVWMDSEDQSAVSFYTDRWSFDSNFSIGLKLVFFSSIYL